MTEYIITERQLKTATEAYSERDVPLPITSVFISGDKLPEIVRCRDCVSCYRDETGMWCCLYGTGFYRRPRGEDDFCSKGERRDA